METSTAPIGRNNTAKSRQPQSAVETVQAWRWNARPLKIINQRTETSRDWEASVTNRVDQAVNALQTGSGTSLAVENIPAMHDPTQPTFASECEIA
jgi:hypothetical protein